MNLKKGRRKKPQRGSATRVTPRESNFQSAEKPQGSRNCEGGKGRPQGRAGHRKPDTSKGDLKVKRECRDVARVKPSGGQGAVQAGESSEAELNLITETSSKETMSQGSWRSEVANWNEQKWPRGGLKTINKGTHADHGRNPKRDRNSEGRQGAGNRNRLTVT